MAKGHQILTPYEQQLRDEVIYLHSLWHKGPPSIQIPNQNSRINLHVSHSTSFKKSKKNKPRYPTNSGSDPFLEMQQKVVNCCNEFFSKRFSLDINKKMDDVQDSEEFKFFYSFFVENRELRDFYEKNQYSGEFCCLVCCGNDRFEGCFGIVQHSLKMIRLNKLQWVHKVLSFVICKVLGWEFTRLPTVVVNSVPLSQSLANLGKTLKSLNDDGKNAIEVIGNRVPGVEAAKEGGTEFEGSKSSEASYVPWPDPKPDDECPLTSWLPKPNAQESLVTCKLSAEELARFSMVQLQQRCVEKCKCFLPAVSGFESDGDEENDDSDDDLINEDVLEECEEFKHFLQLFTESRELREYYENHNEDGEFCCMICGAIDKKVWRTFKGCSGLLQHAVGISKTKKKKAHRVFGLAICKVLGWDFSRIPSVVLKREPLSTLLSKSGMLQTCVEEVDSSTENDVII